MLSKKFIMFLIFHYYIIIWVLDHQQRTVLFLQIFKIFYKLFKEKNETVHFVKYFEIAFINYIYWHFVESSSVCKSVSEIILRWTLSNFISDFMTNQIISCFNCFLNCSFWSSFQCIFSRFSSMIKTFSCIYHLSFICIFTNTLTEIHSLA